MFDVAIIGCGVVGAACAYTLSKYTISCVVLEEQNDVATGTTKANSAILHAGYDPPAGSEMAALNVQGVKLAKQICADLDVPYKQVGSLVVGYDKSQLAQIQALYQNGVANGVSGLAILSGEKAKKMEPSLSEKVMGALYAPTAAIVSPWEYALAMAQVAVKNGVTLKLNSKVQTIAWDQDHFDLTTEKETVSARFVINAAGVFAHQVASMLGKPAFESKPARGMYYLLDKSEGERVHHIVFSCPTKLGKGVLVTPTVDGNLIVGPDHVPSLPDDTATTAKGLEEVAAAAKINVPSINFRANIRNFAGVRAATDQKGFAISADKSYPHMIHLAGIQSPGLSAAPAIATKARDMLSKAGLLLIDKPHFDGRRSHTVFARLTPLQKRDLIKSNPDYGQVVCRCQCITKGEILQSLQQPIPPVSVDGVKRRCGAGMGRCQGGFCGPGVVQILAQHYGVSPVDILQDLNGSYLLTGKTKGE